MKYLLISHFPDHSIKLSEPIEFDQAAKIYTKVTGKRVSGEPQDWTWTAKLDSGEVIELKPAESLPKHGGPIAVDDLVDDFTPEQHDLALKRATDAFGGYVADHDSEEFEEEFIKQLKSIAAEMVFDKLVEQGFFIRDGVDEDGLPIYNPTSQGEQLLNQMETSDDPPDQA